MPSFPAKVPAKSIAIAACIAALLSISVSAHHSHSMFDSDTMDPADESGDVLR